MYIYRGFLSLPKYKWCCYAAKVLPDITLTVIGWLVAMWSQLNLDEFRAGQKCSTRGKKVYHAWATTACQEKRLSQWTFFFFFSSSPSLNNKTLYVFSRVPMFPSSPDVPLQAAPFIVLEHCSGKSLMEWIVLYIYVSLKHEFSCYSVLLLSIY